MKKGFDNDMYLKIQSEHIRERIGSFEGKLYLEFGGKLFDDYHASRVLPGFMPDSKLRMLLQLKDVAEVVIVINAEDIIRSKKRADLGIGYDEDVLRLLTIFRRKGLLVNNVVITRYTHSDAIDRLVHRLQKKGIAVSRHYAIEGYPNNVSHIVSDDGFGKNDYVETTRPLVIITAPGPGSGKMATCLSQLYHDSRKGLRSGYAKFETFPVWNLPLAHEVNLAYEAATADLNDVNMIDPFHMAAYNKTAINYNRDVEIFPVLQAIFNSIYGSSPYKSPTDMGVNMVGFCITDDEACREASRQEIIRRYFKAKETNVREESDDNREIYKIELLMKQAEIKETDRAVVVAARERAAKEKGPAAAIELPNGKIITGGSSKLMGPSAAAVLNAIKELAGIPHEVSLVAEKAITPIQTLKVNCMGSKNPALHLEEILIALSVSAADDENAKKALDKLTELRHCEVHTTVQLSPVDINTFKKLQMERTSDPIFENKEVRDESKR